MKLLRKQRLEFITSQIQLQRTVHVSDLSVALGVTEKTIRLDLIFLEQAHILRRIHGGAEVADLTPPLLPSNSYKTRFTLEKSAIAREALKLINEGDIILLDDGSTSLALATLLGNFNLTVLTNDILIINELISKPKITLYVIGGRLQREGDSLLIYGDDAIQFIKKYRVDKLFLGTSTIDLQNGLMIYYYGDRSTKRAFMGAAKNIICLADSSKFDESAFIQFSSIEELDIIITDSNIDHETLQKYEALGVPIIVSDVNYN